MATVSDSTKENISIIIKNSIGQCQDGSLQNKAMKYTFYYVLTGRNVILCSTETCNSIKYIKYLCRNFSMCGTKLGPAEIERGMKVKACPSRISQASMESKAED